MSAQTYNLTSAELAVLIDHMTGGRLLDQTAVLSDLKVNEKTLGEAEENLLDQGLLISLPFEETSGVTSQLATVLGAALTPDTVCIVRTIHRDHTDPLVILSFTAESITRNTVASSGEHVFTELADQGEALTAILSAGGALDAPNDIAASEPKLLEELLKDAQRLVILMVVEDPAEVEAVAHSLAWVETDEGLWLVEGAGDGETPLAQPVEVAGLRQRIGAVLERQG